MSVGMAPTKANATEIENMMVARPASSGRGLQEIFNIWAQALMGITVSVSRRGTDRGSHYGVLPA